MFKSVFLCLLLLISFSGRTQDTIHIDLPTVSHKFVGHFNPFSDHLFRGIENPVNYYHKSAVLIKSRDSVNITKLAKGSFSIKPICTAKSIVLYAVDSLSGDTLQELKRIVRHVPPTELYLGNAIDGMSTHLLPNALLHVNYGFNESVPLKICTHVLNAEITFMEHTFKINGDRIPKEVVDELYKLRRVYGTPNITIELTAKTSCPSCIARNRTMTITLI